MLVCEILVCRAVCKVIGYKYSRTIEVSQLLLQFLSIQIDGVPGTFQSSIPPSVI